MEVVMEVDQGTPPEVVIMEVVIMEVDQGTPSPGQTTHLPSAIHQLASGRFSFEKRILLVLYLLWRWSLSKILRVGCGKVSHSMTFFLEV